MMKVLSDRGRKSFNKCFIQVKTVLSSYRLVRTCVDQHSREGFALLII